MAYVPLSDENIKNITEDYFKPRLEKAIQTNLVLIGLFSKEEKPTIIFVAAQPGAGKTKVAKLIKQELKSKGGYIHIDADRLREKIPNHQSYQSSETQADAGRLVKHLRNSSFENNFNIIEEGTFRDAKSLDKFIDNLVSTHSHPKVAAPYIKSFAL